MELIAFRRLDLPPPARRCTRRPQYCCCCCCCCTTGAFVPVSRNTEIAPIFGRFSFGFSTDRSGGIVSVHTPFSGTDDTYGVEVGESRGQKPPHGGDPRGRTARQGRRHDVIYRRRGRRAGGARTVFVVSCLCVYSRGSGGSCPSVATRSLTDADISNAPKRMRSDGSVSACARQNLTVSRHYSRWISRVFRNRACPVFNVL